MTKFFSIIFLLLVAMTFTIFINAPIIAKVYNLMLYDITQVEINIKFVIGCMLLVGIMKYKYEPTEEKEFSEQFSDSICANIATVVFSLMMLGIAHVYTWLLG